ncbi:MAG: FeoB-associated Cys-rich membrane protein [Pirellulales bacterium]
MTWDWQTPIVLLLAAVAAVYLLRRAWAVVKRKRAGGCGSCGTCPSQQERTGTTLPLVEINRDRL